MKLIFRYRQLVDIPGRMTTHSCIESGLLLIGAAVGEDSLVSDCAE
ncbi:hypothetical protein J2W55_000939 [Mucilaginibacter pocheonensis]|uniref:Uncharacterized protein n=1 Tax=Mucilaginibacter pocheonensis TaxID=398050 RepID=A0ABU1T7A1_9SPHI|nr:hypothetical protein [Mucilaginibacter pocheonensis]